MTELVDWIKKSEKNIKFNDNEKYYTVEYLNVNCRIEKPNKTNNFYIISSNNKVDSEMYDIMNRYCIEKKPSEKVILSKLIKNIEKYSQDIKSTIISTSIDDFDLAHYKLKSELIKMIETSKPLICNSNDSHNVTKLFNKTSVFDVIINEFLECKMWANRNKIELEICDKNLLLWKVTYSPFINIPQNVEMEIIFQNELYPNYPPIVKILGLKLKDSLVHRISNSKMTQLEYWTPTRGIKYIIQRVKNILEKFGNVDKTEGVVGTLPLNPFVLNIEQQLIKLSSFIDCVNDDEIDKDEPFIKFNFNSTDSTNTSKSSKHTVQKLDYKKSNWKAGTGYGSHSSQNWDPSEYIKLQEEKDNMVSNIITVICKELSNLKEDTSECIEIGTTISKSLLIPHLIQHLNSTTLLEIRQRENTFKLYFGLIEILLNKNLILLFNTKYNNITLYESLEKLIEPLEMAYNINNTNEFVSHALPILQTMKIIYDHYNKQNQILHPTITENITEIVTVEQNLSIQELYVKTMTKYVFESADIANTNFHYKTELHASKSSNWSQCHKRLAVEIPSLKGKNQLPVNYNASIFLRIDENNPNVMRALITGPDDTPYDSGCFIFDIYMDGGYPNKPPSMWFINHNGVRFNPNLYDSGKLCLSLLGTWHGTGGETWNKNTSSLLQVLISIQAQILISEPYFNEPGYEGTIGQPTGIKNNENYNDKIRYYTLEHNIKKLLQNPKLYPQFEDVVKNHFKLKKDYIKKLCNEWESKSSTYKSQITEINKIIFEQLDNL